MRRRGALRTRTSLRVAAVLVTTTVLVPLGVGSAQGGGSAPAPDGDAPPLTTDAVPVPGADDEPVVQAPTATSSTGAAVVLLHDRANLLPLSTASDVLRVSAPAHPSVGETSTIAEELAARARLAGRTVVGADDPDAADVSVVVLPLPPRGAHGLAPGEPSPVLRDVPGLEGDAGTPSWSEPTVVVLAGGADVELPAAVLAADAALHVGDTAETDAAGVADVLLGQAAPDGRLAVDFPVVDPHYPRHHGLSFTDHEVTALTAPPDLASQPWVIVDLRQTGDHTGRTHVHVYLAPPGAHGPGAAPSADDDADADVTHGPGTGAPPAVVGWTAVDVGPGEEVQVRVPVDSAALTEAVAGARDDAPDGSSSPVLLRAAPEPWSPGPTVEVAPLPPSSVPGPTTSPTPEPPAPPLPPVPSEDEVQPSSPPAPSPPAPGDEPTSSPGAATTSPGAAPTTGPTTAPAPPQADDGTPGPTTGPTRRARPPVPDDRAAAPDPVPGDPGTTRGGHADIELRATVPRTVGSLTLTVDPGAVSLENAEVVGDRLRLTGATPGVTVRDTRTGADAERGWTVAGRLDGLSGPEGSIDPGDLTWTPRAAEPVEGLLVGPALVPRLDGGPGLGRPALLATASGAARSGPVGLGADLRLEAPAQTPAGHYTGTLTLTLFPVE